MRIVVNRIESARVERARPPDDAVDLVTLRQQQLRQIRAVLAGNTRDQRFVRHDLPAGDLKSSLTMASPESKHQKPSSKHQINPKFQAPNRGPRFELGTWSLELPWSLVFGALSDCAFPQSRYTARVFHLTFPGLTRRSRLATALLAGLTGLSGVAAIAQPTLPGTQELTWQDDLSTRMVQGIDKFLMREIDRSVEQRK